MNTRVLLLCLFICFSIGVRPASANTDNAGRFKQTVPYRQYGIKDGLIQSQALAVFQDSWGYLWFSTHLGLSRFDGRGFRNYHFNNELKGFSGPTQCFMQSEECIYVVFLHGIVRFNPDGTIDKIPFPEGYYAYTHMNLISGDDIYLTNVYCDQSSPDKFCMRYNILTGEFEKIGNSRPSNWVVLSFNKTVEENVFNGILHQEEMADEGKKYYTFKLDAQGWMLGEEIKAEHGAVLSTLVTSNDGNFYFTGNENDKQGFLYKVVWQQDTVQLSYISSMPSRIRAACQLDEQTWLVSCENPTRIYILRNGQPEALNIPDFMVNMILKDRDGNVWLATEKGPVNLYSLNFSSWAAGMNSSPAIWDFAIDSNGSKWFNTYGSGLWRTDTNNRLLPVSVRHDGRLVETVFGYFNGTQDNKGRIYFNNSNGIVVYDPARKGKNNEFRFLPVGVCLCSWFDPVTGNVFAGTGKGDKRYFVRIRPDLTVDMYPWEKGYILSICRDGNGKIRMGAFNSMGHFDEEQQMVVLDAVGNAGKDAIDMVSDKWGNLWKASQFGLFVEDRSGKDTILLNTLSPWILNYKDSYILAGTDNDILVIVDLNKYAAGDTGCLRTFNRYQGIDLVEFGQAGAYIDTEGYVWVWGLDNFLRFRPEELMNQPANQQNPVSVGPIYKRNKDTDWQLVQGNKEYLLDTEDNFLRYELLGASLIHPDDLRFRYRLKPYSDQWMVIQDRNIEFQNLPHGRYTLEVQSSVDGVNWSESSFSPLLEIRTPFWLSTGGIILMVCLISIAILFMLFVSRLLIIRNQEKKRQVDFLRFRAVQSKHIPHFTGNVLNNISYLVNKDVEVARQYIADFSEFSHLTLLNSTALHRSLEEEIYYAGIYLKLEKLRFEDKLEYTVDVSPEIDTTIPVPLMVLQTFCENALKHGLRHKEGVGKVKVEVMRRDDRLILAVEDNGIGRRAAKEKNTSGTGEGLLIVQQQLSLWSKKASMHVHDLYNNDKTPAGTRFEVHLPWKY